MSEEISSINEGSVSGTEDAISIPLYICGLAVSVLGVLAVNSALSDTQFGTTTLVLTVLGFVFSLACRWLRIKVRVVEILAACIALYFLYRFLTHSFSLAVFIPPDETQSDIIMAIVLEWLTVARSWVLTTDESVVFSCVPSIAMIGLVGASNINTELLVYFFFYLICATFLLLHQSYLTQRSWAISTTVSTGWESRLISLQAAVSLFAGIAVIMMASIVVVPLHAIGKSLSLANALKDLVGAAHTADVGTNSTSSSVNLSDDPNFQVGTGSGFSASDIVMMHVLPGDHSEHYYRGRTYDTYIGSGWTSSEQNNTSMLDTSIDDSPEPSIDAYNLQQGGVAGADPTEPVIGDLTTHSGLITRFSMDSGSTTTFYLPYGTARIFLPSRTGIQITQSADNSVSTNIPVGGSFGYVALSDYPDVSIESLRASSPPRQNYPLAIRKEYIDQRGADVVSLEDQERLSLTARQIIQTLPKYRRTEFDKAEAIRQWVSQRAKYSLDVSAVPAGDDAVSYFLFDARKGYCDLYASSMAVLCRYAGIPARVATGFDSGIANDRGGYDLRERDKHAWVEVWFPKYGWQIFDPTEGSVADTSSTESQFDFGWLLKMLAAIRVYFDIHGVLPFIIVLGILGGIAYVVKVEVYDRFYGDAPVLKPSSGYPSLAAARKASMEAAALYTKNVIQLRYFAFEQVFRRAGVRRQMWQTPAEFLLVVQNALDNAGPELSDCAGEIMSAARRLTDDVVTATYAPINLVGESLVELEEQGGGIQALESLRKLAPAIRKHLISVKKEPARH